MSQAFTYRVSLTHVPSNQTIEFDDEFDYPTYVRGDDWEHDCVFLWADGNYSCDCNRHLFFHRATMPEFYEEHQCGDNEYRVNWIRNLETGNIVYAGEEERRV